MTTNEHSNPPLPPPPPGYPTPPPGASQSRAKWVVPLIACGALFVATLVIGAIAGAGSEKNDTAIVSTTAPTIVSTTAPTTTAPPTTIAPAPPPPTAPAETVSQTAASRAAAGYMKCCPMSRKGLIHQLKFMGFSDEDATYGTDAQNADWNAQAAKKAARYMKCCSMSRKGLITQLEYEKFSIAEALYGVNTTGL